MAELKVGSPLSLLPRDDVLDRWMLFFYSLLIVKSRSVVPTTQETYVFS